MPPVPLGRHLLGMLGAIDEHLRDQRGEASLAPILVGADDARQRVGENRHGEHAVGPVAHLWRHLPGARCAGALGADERPERRPAGKAGRFRVDQGKAREARVADEHVPSLAAGAPGGRERLEQRGLQALAHGTGPRPNPPPCIHIRKTLPR